MLKGFAVENYRGFRNRVEMDLSRIRDFTFHCEYIQNGIVDKCMIVGRNGCGKTNFGLALFDIVGVLTDFHIDEKQKDSFGFLNGDSDIPYATFSYEFRFGSIDVFYEYRKTSPEVIVYERMSVDGKQIFLRDGQTADYSGLRDYGAGGLRIEIGDGALSVLRVIANNTRQLSDSPIAMVMAFVKGMLYVRSTQEGDRHIGLTLVPEQPQDHIVRNGCTEDFGAFLRDMTGSDVDLAVTEAVGVPGRLVIRTGRKLLDFDRYASSGHRVLLLHYFWMRLSGMRL